MGPETRDPGPGTRDSFQRWDPGPETLDPKGGTQDSRLGTQPIGGTRDQGKWIFSKFSQFSLKPGVYE